MRKACCCLNPEDSRLLWRWRQNDQSCCEGGGALAVAMLLLLAMHGWQWPLAAAEARLAWAAEVATMTRKREYG